MDTVASQGYIAGSMHSAQEWKGLASNKWSAPERLHLRAKDQLADKIEGVDPPVLGRKHFMATYSGTTDYKPTLKTFPDRANRETSLTPKSKLFRKLLTSMLRDHIVIRRSYT